MTSTLKSVEKTLTKRPYVPASDDPREELKTLVLQHKAITKAAVAIDNMSSDKKKMETGEVIKCPLPEDVMVDLQETAKRQRDRAGKLESAMLRELKKIPIYQLFLSKVFGIGPIVAAYLVSEIDIHEATKPSSLRRFCGMAVVNGRLERPTRGVKNHFNREMRTRLYQAFSAMWKNAAKTSAARPNGSTCKYLEIWNNYKIRQLASGRVVDGKIQRIVNGEPASGNGAIVSAKGFVHSTGWHKACDVFLGDLYIVWRALEGLPVWPGYVEWITGYGHGGIPRFNEPEMLTVEQALARVGVVGPLRRPQRLSDHSHVDNV